MKLNSLDNQNVVTMLETLFPKGYQVIEHIETEGTPYNFDGAHGYLSKPTSTLVVRPKYSRKTAYRFHMYHDSYGFLGTIWYMYTDLQKKRFTNFLGQWDKEKFKKSLDDYIKEGIFERLKITLE